MLGLHGLGWAGPKRRLLPYILSFFFFVPTTDNFTDLTIADPHSPRTSKAKQSDRFREARSRRMKAFKKEFTLEERANESAAMIANYPDRIPVIVERFSRSSLPEMEKRKYLVPREMPVGQFIFILRSRLHLSPGTALFVFVNNTLPQTANLMGSVYDVYKDKEDGFLYMCYSSEKTFGSSACN
ncbi:hypothetical protein BRADI_4g45390v3 [Brachypodium distachyon]|uniref:Autophagy-related protein n=2 Tax=Brachypodium distachyon TaxID=15368 RepID=A0A0Q3HWN1_BRADI|nr:hypothetical protein BRADI_4g45390v3 [Brachypodium distachyon]